MPFASENRRKTLLNLKNRKAVEANEEAVGEE
ncbi:unnamed protein product, partial [Enterobius vermicularis]|uniref:IBB domain-containing protein n=1 Tax=Enterobius vermicularis TaxID=51028 RepID=A0A0N4UVC4_ENTVE